MKNPTIALLLVFAFICVQSFSQKSKPNIKPDPVKEEIGIKKPGSKAYCSSTYTNITDDWITNVTLNSINNSSGQEGTGSYGDYTSINTGLLAGNTYTLSVSFSSGSYNQHVRAWFDWNHDDDFYDAGETFYLGYGASQTFSLNITVPMSALVGPSRMRIIEQYSTDPGPCDPHNNNYGETEDYSIYINSNNYCSAIGGCDEYISEFQIEYMVNVTGCDGYMDYGTSSFYSSPLNVPANITVENGNGYAADQCGIWIDWNRDNDFYDANESLTVYDSPGDGPYFAIIAPPPGTTVGDCRLRVRITYNETPVPCDPTNYFYGEVEDYTITLTPEVDATWNGAVDNNWHNADNWNTINIPDATTDVIIPNVANKCWVWAADAECKNLTVEAGTTHDLRIWDKDLTVHGNMNIFGMLTMDHPLGDLEVEGSIYWEAGSSAYMLGYSGIWIHADWVFKSGSNVHLDDGLVSFEGSGGSYLRNFSYNSYFHDIAVYKTGGDWLSISSNTTYDLNINGNLFLQPDAIVYVYSPESLILKGDLYNAGYLYCYDGDFVFDGDVQSINEHLSYTTTTEFNFLVLSSTTSTTVLNKDITVSMGLRIESGQFIPNDHTISVGWYWYNQVGPAGFVEGNSRVRFFGTWDSDVDSDENFNIIEVDKSGGFLNVFGPTVTCQHYDWTQGGISVRVGGEFTAFDLIDNGIYGMMGVDNTGGTLNIHNYDGYVDLNGSISLTGGVMNVYGGTGISYWPFTSNASIYMMDGVLDFHDQGIYITNYTSYTLTENITGGTIRTAGGFWGQSSDFSPDYGIMEFYGSTDANIYTINACHLNDVIINKSTKESTKVNSQVKTNVNPLIDERSGKPLGDGTKSNTINQAGFLDINGSLVINNGVLNSNGHNIQIEGNWTNNVGDAGFNESTGWVIFDGYNKIADIQTNETFNNLMLSNASGGIFGLTFMDGINVNVNNDLDLQWSTLEMNQSSELHVGGDVFIAGGAGLNVDDGYNVLSVGGNWTNENYSNTQYYGFWPGGEEITFDGVTDQIINTNAPEENFTNVIINKTAGYFRPNDDIQIYGGLQILDGDWWDYVAGLTHSWYGNILIQASGNYYPQGITQFKGSTSQYYNNNGGIAMFGDVIIDKSGVLYLNSDLVVFNDHTTIVEEGILNLNGHIYKATGWVDIKDGSEIIVDAGASLSLGHRLFVYTGGQLTTIGESGNKALVYNDAFGQDYSIEIFGGTISANHTIFEDLAPTGLWVHDGSFIDPVNSFNNCSFDGYTSPAGSTWLIIDNNEDITIDNISFPNNPGGANASNIGKNMSHGHITITNASGAFAGPAFEYDPYDRIDWEEGEIVLDLTVFLEGPFNGTNMDTDINAVLPINHPFDPPLPYFGNPIPDWYYSGGGNVGSIPASTIVDWVLIQLRDATSPGSALPGTTIGTAPAFLLNNGSIVGLDGSSFISFSATPVNSLYVIIWHRNHLGVISANPLNDVGGIHSYNFSSGSGQAYGGTTAQKPIGSKWVMMSGDGNGDGNILNSDKIDIWNIQSGNGGFLESDYNLNGQVNNPDKNDMWYENIGEGSQIPE